MAVVAVGNVEVTKRHQPATASITADTVTVHQGHVELPTPGSKQDTGPVIVTGEVDQADTDAVFLFVTRKEGRVDIFIPVEQGQFGCCLRHDRCWQQHGNQRSQQSQANGYAVGYAHGSMDGFLKKSYYSQMMPPVSNFIVE